jgi:hypothetical protein
MKFILVETAKKELIDAIRYYNKQQNGLGFKFANNVKNSLLNINDFPDSWPKISKRLRRYLLKQFPYAIIYQFKDDQITILAIMHMHRNPMQWNGIE